MIWKSILKNLKNLNFKVAGGEGGLDLIPWYPRKYWNNKKPLRVIEIIGNRQHRKVPKQNKNFPQNNRNSKQTKKYEKITTHPTNT